MTMKKLILVLLMVMFAGNTWGATVLQVKPTPTITPTIVVTPTDIETIKLDIGKYKYYSKNAKERYQLPPKLLLILKSDSEKSAIYYKKNIILVVAKKDKIKKIREKMSAMDIKEIK